MEYPSGFKGYRLYDPQSQRFFISRDVVFHETTFPFHSLLVASTTPNFFNDKVIPKPILDQTLVDPPTCDQTPDQPLLPTPINTNTPIPQTRHSNRTQRAPSYLQDYHCNVTYPIQSHLSYDRFSPSYRSFVVQVNNIFEPQFFHQAVKIPEWQQAMSEELTALKATNTWTVQPLPEGKRAIGCKWVYKAKLMADGSLDRYKARLVAQGFTQQVGIDFLDTFSPVAKLTSMRILLAMAAELKWHFFQLDINNAFLNGDLVEEVYMKLPHGNPIKGNNLVCKLNKSLYGLRQASRQWFSKFSSTILKFGFVKCSADHFPWELVPNWSSFWCTWMTSSLPVLIWTKSREFNPPWQQVSS